MAHLLGHLLAFVLLAAACWAPGAWAVRGLRGAGGLGSLAPLARVCLGLAVWTGLLFVLGATGLLRPIVLRSALALALGLAIAWLFLHARRESVSWPRLDPARLAASAALAALLVPFFLLALAPTVSWDAGVYHLQVPKLFLAAGSFRPVPFNVYATWPLHTELLFALAMAAMDYVLAKLVHFGFGLLVLWTIYAGCRAFHRPASGWLAGLFFLANGVVGFELRVANVDLAHAFYFSAAFLFMLRAVDEPDDAGPALLLSGLCAGLMAGVKLNGIVGAAIIGALFLPRLARAWRSGDGWPASRRFLWRFAGPVAVLWLPWVVRTAWATGNPFYPFFHQAFGGPDWSPALTDQLRAWQSSIGMGRTPVDYLLLPLRVILAGGDGYHRFDGELGALWILLLPLAIRGAWRPPAGGRMRHVRLARRCLGVAGLYFVFWSLSSQQMRLLLPALPLLAMAGGVGVVELLDRLPAARWRRAGVALAFAAAAGLVVWTQGPVLAAGYRTFGVYLRAEGDLLSTAVHPAYAFVNAELPPDATLLFVNHNQGFFCDRELYADSFFEASQIADWLAPAKSVEELRRMLASRGVTHVLVERRDWGIAYPAALGEMLGRREVAERVYRSGDGRFAVFELQQPSPGALTPSPSPRGRGEPE